MQKLACFIILVAIISKILQSIFFRSGIVIPEEADIMYERILVVSIHDQKEKWEDKIRQILNTAVYKESITVCVQSGVRAHASDLDRWPLQVSAVPL